MKKYIHTLIAIALTLSASNACAGGGGEQTKTVNVCQGGVSNCNVGNINVRMATVGNLNAVGDKLSFDTKGVSTRSLGRITKPVETTVAISSEGQTMFSFIPTEGNKLVKDKEIKILFYAFDINNMPQGLSNANIYTEATNGKTAFPWANTMLKVYRQLPGEIQWTELAASFTDAPVQALKPIQVTIYPDARAVIQTPAHKDENGNLVQPQPMTTDLSKLF